MAMLALGSGGVAPFDRWGAARARGGGGGPPGGYRRYAWTAADAALREWFVGAAQERGLDVVADRAGNLWAWSGDPDADGPGLVVGSHLDSVPDGGAFDGPLGVVSAFAALDELRARGIRLRRPLAIACFGDEEGARFGVACAGSRLLTGALDPDRARALADDAGTSMAEAMRSAGLDAGAVGRDEEPRRRIGPYVELHIERAPVLADGAASVGVGPVTPPPGRGRLALRGRADHAGTPRLQDRSDPMLPLAAVIRTARDAAAMHDVLAT